MSKATAADRARQEVERLRDAERDLTREFFARAASLEALVPSIGDALLDAHLAPDVDTQEAIASEGAGRHELTGSIARAHADLEGIEASINAARHRRAAAIRAFYHAQADDLRREAKGLRSEADKRQVKTDKLLAELQAWEGVSYRPYRPDDPVPGQVIEHFSIVVKVPKSDFMRQQASGLDRDASALEETAPGDGGGVKAYTLDDVAAALYADPLAIGPRELDVREFCAAREAAAWAKCKGVPLRGAYLVYDLSWQNSEMIPARCSVKLGALAYKDAVPKDVPAAAVRSFEDVP